MLGPLMPLCIYLTLDAGASKALLILALAPHWPALSPGMQLPLPEAQPVVWLLMAMSRIGFSRRLAIVPNRD
jgi:hypothetical protein